MFTVIDTSEAKLCETWYVLIGLNIVCSTIVCFKEPYYLDTNFARSKQGYTDENLPV